MKTLVNATSVLIVDDHDLVRRSIRAVLNKLDGFRVVGEAKNGREAIALAEAEKPDIILMDISMPGMNGLDAMAQIRRLKIPAYFIVLSMHISSTLIKNAVKQGASAYLLKGGDLQELTDALQAVSEGRTYFENLSSGPASSPP